MAVLDSVRVSGQQRNIAFFDEVLSQAMTYRLSFVQRNAEDHRALERELPNLWQAARQSYEQRDWERVMSFRDALHPFLDLRGYWSQSLALNEWAREAAHALGDAVSAIRWTHDRADILHQRGEYDEAKKLYRDAEDAYRAIDKNEVALRSRHMRSLVVRAQGHLAEAEQLCETTIDESKRLGLDRWLAHPLYVRALLARDRGDFRRARQCIQESLSLLKDTDETAMIAQCHHFLGELALLENDLSQAHTNLETSVQLSQQVGILRRVAATQRLLGDLARLEGDFDKAERIYHEALMTASRLQDRPQLARLFVSQAKIMSHRGRWHDAANLLRGAISTYGEIGDARGVACVSLILAHLYLRQMKWKQALHAALAALGTAQSAHLLSPRLLFGLRRRWSRL